MQVTSKQLSEGEELKCGHMLTCCLQQENMERVMSEVEETAYCPGMP